MCTSVNPNINQPGLMNNKSVVLTFDTNPNATNMVGGYGVYSDFTRQFKMFICATIHTIIPKLP